VSIGPANEPEKKKEKPKEEGEKEELVDSSMSSLFSSSPSSSLFSSSPSSPSSFSSSSDSRVTHDVFINFSPNDDSKIFVYHLDVALAKARIESCTDYQLHMGTELELEEILEDTHISILVFSQNYTESSSCLNEMQQIMEYRRTHGHMVMPVFYDVDPSDVRHQRGAFGKNLQATAERRYLDRKLRENMLLSWKSALTQAASLVGWDATNYR
ncbi:disease resistance protein (TIR-NBS-LRR class), partial [Trifolium pratense]